MSVYHCFKSTLYWLSYSIPQTEQHRALLLLLLMMMLLGRIQKVPSGNYKKMLRTPQKNLKTVSSVCAEQGRRRDILHENSDPVISLLDDRDLSPSDRFSQQMQMN